MTELIEAVRVDVYSDYTCPWCYVGWARLERALEHLPDGVAADVRWHPFEIHPEVPAEGMPVEDLGYAPDRWAQMQVALRSAAADEGLEVSKRPKVSNTHRALLAGAYVQAEEPDRFPAFHEALFRGYFAEGRDLGDPAVVDDIAAKTGVDVPRMRAGLESDRFEAVLVETGRAASAMQIASTPTFVFGDRYAAVGAQPVEVLARGLEAAMEDLRDPRADTGATI